MLMNKVMTPKEFYAKCHTEADDLARERLNTHKRTIQENAEFSAAAEAKARFDSIKAKKAALINFSEEVKKTFLAECIYTVFDDAIDQERPTVHETAIGHQMIDRFIESEGVDVLLSRYRKKNYMLSEFCRLTNKFHGIVMEAAKKDGCDDCDDLLSIDPIVKNDFFQSLKLVNPDSVISTIKDRVTSAMSDFVDSNASDRIDIKEIIQRVQAKTGETTSDEIKQESGVLGKVAINKIRNKPRHVLDAMVKSMGESVISNPDLGKVYLEGANLKTEALIDDTKVMYTVLEMLNTAEMVNVDSKYIIEVLKDLES